MTLTIYMGCKVGKRKFLAWRPGHGTPAKHVDVKMKHRLARAGSGIDHGSVTILRQPFVVCDARGHAKQVAQQRLVFLCSLVERLNMFKRNHEQVSRSLRVNIANNYGSVVLVDEVGWDLPRDYFTE